MTATCKKREMKLMALSLNVLITVNGTNYSPKQPQLSQKKYFPQKGKKHGVVITGIDSRIEYSLLSNTAKDYSL